jgi:uncharacterized protein YbaR (Trm112 family)
MGNSKVDIPNKIPDELLDLIVCPVDKQPLLYTYIDNIDDPILVNIRLMKYYEVKDSIPILLEEELKGIKESELAIIEKNTIRATTKE